MEGGSGVDCVLGDGERLRGRSEVCIFGFEGVLFVDIVVIGCRLRLAKGCDVVPSLQRKGICYQAVDSSRSPWSRCKITEIRAQVMHSTVILCESGEWFVPSSFRVMVLADASTTTLG